MDNFKEILKIISIPVFVASLCCFIPVIVVLFGLGTVTFAASLTDILYGQYKWAFRIVGLVLLGIALLIYIRHKKGICTLKEAEKRRNEILNIVMITLMMAIIGYIIWFYIIIEYIGILLKIW